MSITWTDLASADLRNADLRKADLSGANLRGANLSDTIASRANFTWANLQEVVGPKTILTNAILYEAHLTDAALHAGQMQGADLQGAKLERTALRDADLSHANLSRASMVDADLTNAVLDGAFVHGTSSWNVTGTPASQHNLVITRSYPPHNEPLLTVDDLELAQFLYLLLNNERVRNVIETMTSRAVLILGRFSPSHKAVLDSLRVALRERGYVPLLCDFVPSAKRDLTETIVILAGLSKFVIADLTSAKSLPQELSHIVPLLTSLPIQPIIHGKSTAYGMFEHWKHFPAVLDFFAYRDLPDLLDQLDSRVIAPAIGYRSHGEEEVTRLRRENLRLRLERDALKRSRNDGN